jgi:hypothetical protein
MGPLLELLTHLIRHGPARNPGEAEQLEQLAAAATSGPQSPAQADPPQGDPEPPAPAQPNPGGQS